MFEEGRKGAQNSHTLNDTFDTVHVTKDWPLIGVATVYVLVIVWPEGFTSLLCQQHTCGTGEAHAITNLLYDKMLIHYSVTLHGSVTRCDSIYPQY